MCCWFHYHVEIIYIDSACNLAGPRYNCIVLVVEWLIQTELERNLYRDQEKLACTISCECFHTTT